MPNYQEMTDLTISKDGKEKEKQTEKEKGQEKAEKIDVKEHEKPKGKEQEKAEAEACSKKEKCDVKETDKPKEKEKGKEQERKRDISKIQESKTGITIKELKNEKDLEAKLKMAGDNLIVLDFYATWCMPCKLTAPQIERLAEEYKDVTFFKINVDESEALALKYDVSTLPTFLYIKHGKVVDTVVGSNVERVEEGVRKHMARLSDAKKEKTTAA